MTVTNKLPYTQTELKARALKRVAMVLQGHAEEGRFPHSRFFERLVPDSWITEGISVKGSEHPEHVVPCAFLARACMERFDAGATVDEIAEILETNLRIVRISREEQIHIDFELGYKSTMPPGWVLGESDPLERLTVGKIVLRDRPDES